MKWVLFIMLGFKILSIKIKNIQDEKYYLSLLLEGMSLKGIMIDNGEITKSFFVEGSTNCSVKIHEPTFNSDYKIIAN